MCMQGVYNPELWRTIPYLLCTCLRFTCGLVRTAGQIRMQDVYNPELWRTIPYLLCISLIGIFILLSLRKRFIVDYALPYPSGTASGVLINSLHSIGNKTAERQVSHCSPGHHGCKMQQKVPSVSRGSCGDVWYHFFGLQIVVRCSWYWYGVAWPRSTVCGSAGHCRQEPQVPLGHPLRFHY